MRTLVLNLDPSVLRAADEILSGGPQPIVEEEVDEGYVLSLYDLLDLDFILEPETETAVNDIFPDVPDAEPPVDEIEQSLMCFETLEDSDTEGACRLRVVGYLAIDLFSWLSFLIGADQTETPDCDDEPPSKRTRIG